MRSRVRGAVFVILMLAVCACLAQSPNPQRLFEMGMDAINGVGSDRNPQAALDYLHRAANLGYPPAEVMLGSLYDTGNSVTRDQGQAATWYKKAATQDDPVGQWLLGRLILTGALPRDLNDAAHWLQRSASHGDPFGEYLLGMVKLERQDYTQASTWFRKAAMQGMPQAEEQLGLLLKQGQGSTLDRSEAYVWLLMAYDAGNQSAGVAHALAALQAVLSNDEIDQAKSKARDLEQTANRAVVSRGCTGWPGEFNAMPAPPPPEIQSFCR